ncbi:MAG: IgGFc-binding protein [Myxococcales bacterium]|nr:IgGFc-binding protein [Myxococcales bacterium]
MLVLVGLTSACTIELVDFLGEGDGLGDGGGSLDGATLGDGGDEDEGGGGSQGEPIPPAIFDVAGEQPQVSSCQFAAQFPSHIGCEFYGLDLDLAGLYDLDPYGFIVINPLGELAHVELSRQTGRSWETIDSAFVAGEDEHVFLPTNNQAYGTGKHKGAVYRITSDQPVVVVQANPAQGEAHSSGATMLQPASAWTAETRIAGWRTHDGVGERSFLAILGRLSGTPLTIDLSFGLEADPDLGWTDNPLQLSVEPGEFIRLDALATTDEVDHGTSGTLVISGQEHPSVVFSAHTCAAIPDYQGSCGHMQEQLVSRLEGRRFVAPRMVVGIDPDVGLVHERTMVQVVATEPDTTVEFIHGDGVVLETVIIDPDSPYAVAQAAHDLAVIADKPIVASAYMTNAEITGLGSPSMVQLAPVEEWSNVHWVWVPDGYDTHLLVASSSVKTLLVEQISVLDDLGGTPQAEPFPAIDIDTVADEQLGTREIARVPVTAGIYRVSTDTPSSVVVAGWRVGDGFAYLGGWGSVATDPAG